MSIEHTLIARAKPQILAARLNAIIEEEAGKGCAFDISPTPVALEPRYRFISQASDLINEGLDYDYIVETLPPPYELCCLQIWISPEESFSWFKSERFLKHLQKISHRVRLEISGNKTNIQMRIWVYRKDLPIILTSFQSQFERCELSSTPANSSNFDTWRDTLFMDFFPPPPYSDLLTQSNELKVTPFQSLICAMMEIEPPVLGFYQAVFQPVSPEHDWHRNIQILLDLQYALKLYTGIQVPQRYLQQAPSGDLRQMTSELETKAHNDKPFYFVAVRLGVTTCGERGYSHLNSLSTYVNLFQHGGRPLNYLTENDYRSTLSEQQVVEMLAHGTTHRPGFLVNSSELSGFVHLPPAEILEYRNPPLSVLETLPVRNECLLTGTPIGTNNYAGVEQPVCIPLEIRPRSIHTIAKPDQGKSTLMGHMILDDIEKGMGVAVIDPHGDLIEDLLRLIKKKDVERTIYLDPGNPDYVPLWNPLNKSPGQSISRTADNLVAAFKTVVTGWGDRLEHLLRNGLFGLLQLPGSTFLDLANLLRRKTDESKRLQREILEVVDNEMAYQFWRNDFSTYSREALGPPMHKLSKLLLSDRSSLMLSQPENLIDFRMIMDSGKILLVNLSTIGPEEREILGCFILSLLHLTALGRSDILIDDRKQFHIHVDEAHRFITEALEDLIFEARKFGVSLNLTHQHLSQFDARKIGALSSVGTTLIMNVDAKDARHLIKDLQDRVTEKDIITLEKGHGIARIGTDIVRFETPGKLEIPQQHNKEAILTNSFRYYYRPVHVIRQSIRKKANSYSLPIYPLSSGQSAEKFEYEEF